MTLGPTRWKILRTPQEVGIHRILDCPLYENCLSSCAVKYWQGFTCKLCSMRKGKWKKKEVIFTPREEDEQDYNINYYGGN